MLRESDDVFAKVMGVLSGALERSRKIPWLAAVRPPISGCVGCGKPEPVASDRRDRGARPCPGDEKPGARPGLVGRPQGRRYFFSADVLGAAAAGAAGAAYG